MSIFNTKFNKKVKNFQILNFEKFFLLQNIIKLFISFCNGIVIEFKIKKYLKFYFFLFFI